MSAQRGTAFLLKISDGAAVPAFTTVAGLRTTKMSIHGEPVAISAKEASGWRELLDGGGARSVSIIASGIFLGSAAESKVRGNALSGSIDHYELSFEGGEKMRGKFLVQRLDYSGDFNGERNYTITLESSGEVAHA